LLREEQLVKLNIMGINVFTSQERREIDAFTISHDNISSIDLMERASWQCSSWIMSKFSRSHKIYIFCGKGNNGGDGLAIARQLAINDYEVTVFHLFPVDEFSKDALINYQRLHDLKRVSVYYIDTIDIIPVFSSDDIIVDAILGSGLNHSLEGKIANVVECLNRMDACKIAIDIATGLSGEGIVNNGDLALAVQYTLTFQYPFLSFFFPENQQYIGQWLVMDIGLNASCIKSVKYSFVSKNDIIIKQRNAFSYKNQWGHALIFAGSRGMMGAAILSSKACLKSGSGLVTVHVPKNLGSLVHVAFPEAIVSHDQTEDFISSMPDINLYSAIAMGPGMGKNPATHDLIFQVICNVRVPLVLDADALNILSQHSDWLTKLPENTIITPHPGEFDRLFGKCSNSAERLSLQIAMATKYRIIIILKGHHTSIVTSDGRCFFNSTGNAGMATAGSGDVLTGIVLSFLCQGYIPAQAAIQGVFLHGMAGDIALKSHGYESLIASDIIDSLGKAFVSLYESNFSDIEHNIL
jgi:NAD(P)H-hydrate epimerase